MFQLFQLISIKIGKTCNLDSHSEKKISFTRKYVFSDFIENQVCHSVAIQKKKKKTRTHFARFKNGRENLTKYFERFAGNLAGLSLFVKCQKHLFKLSLWKWMGKKLLSPERI